MRLATIKLHGAEVAGIVTGKGILPVAALNAYKGTGWKEDMMSWGPKEKNVGKFLTMVR